jgi:hypothetical protein
MSLLLDSLDFLASHISDSSSDPDLTVKRIRDRAYQIRCYTCGNEVLETGIPQTNPESSESENEQENEIIESEILPEKVPETFAPESLLPPIPNIPGVDRDVLKNLLMSWFYTGYYTAKAETTRSNLT